MKKIVFGMVSILFFFSCKEKKYNGDSYNNYPEMNVLWNECMNIFQQPNRVFTVVAIENNKTDSLVTTADKLKIDDWKNPFLLTDIHAEKFNTQYKVDLFFDTTTHSSTYFYSSLKPENATSKISITRDGVENKTQTVYVEYNDIGFTSSTSYKILLVKDKSLQIQEAIKKPFSKLKKQIRTLYFN